ncbi:MAG: hypothetical protein PUG69_04060 [Ruminococcus sp.]|nr:hypothetical protein [Ruminococcus sp.]
MKKSIIAVALALVAMATLMTACKKNEDFKEKPNTDNKIEYSTDENGDLFITNVNGEKIPVTTDKDGYAEMYEDLVTKTAAQVEKDKEKKEAETAAPATEPETTEKKTEGQTKKVVVGNDDINNGSHDAVIDWR